MARSPYKHAKRQKELAKKKKQEEKRQRKLEKKMQLEESPIDETVNGAADESGESVEETEEVADEEETG
jgi:hypothetical protein